MSQLKLRPPIEADKPYIAKSWFHNIKDNDPLYRHIPNPVYSHHMGAIFEHHWQHSQWLVLSGETTEDWMAGFLCGTAAEHTTYVHYMYVRNRYRGHGFGRHLLKEFVEAGPAPIDAPVYYSVETNQARAWRGSHRGKRDRETEYLGRRWLFNPWALTYTMEPGWWK